MHTLLREFRYILRDIRLLGRNKRDRVWAPFPLRVSTFVCRMDRMDGLNTNLRRILCTDEIDRLDDCASRPGIIGNGQI